MADTRRTPGGQALKARPRPTHTRMEGAPKADNTRRTHGGHKADKKWRRGQGLLRPAFFTKREPHSKLIGEIIK